MSSHRLPLSSRPAFLPDEIARREFATVFRGYDPSEVRTFLNQLAEQQGEGSDRVAELQRALLETEERVKNPELDEEIVTRLLGEQTAQILRSAREAASDMRLKAEEEVSRTLREAHEITTRMREEAEEIFNQRTQEAERVSKEMRESAKQESERMVAQATNETTDLRNRVSDDVARLRAETEAEMLALRQQTQSDLVDERSRVRSQGRDLIDSARAEAQALVERTQDHQTELLEILVRKRKIALAQVEELRAGRHRLLTSYRMVRGTLDEITGELERVEDEARQAAESAGERSAQANGISTEDLSEMIELEDFKLDDDVSSEIISLTSGEDSPTGQPLNLDGSPQHVAETLPFEGEAVSMGDGHQSGQTGQTVLERDDVIVDVVEESEPATVRSSVSSGLVIGETFQSGSSSDTDPGLALRREAAIGKFGTQTTRRLRRAIQEEQDAIVSRLRSSNVDSVQAVIGSSEDHAASYSRTVVKVFREVARAGASSVEGSTGTDRGVIDHTGTAAAHGLAAELVADLRTQLEPVVQALIAADRLPEIGELQSKIANPYKEIKGDYLDQLVNDRVAGVFDQGVAFAR